MNSRVVLICPPYSSLAASGPPLGLLVLADYLRRSGGECSILDLNIEFIRDRFDPKHLLQSFEPICEAVHGLEQESTLTAAQFASYMEDVFSLRHLPIIGDFGTRQQDYQTREILSLQNLTRDAIVPQTLPFDATVSAVVAGDHYFAAYYDGWNWLQQLGAEVRLVGLSISFAEQLAAVLAIARSIKHQLGAVRIVLGGSEATLLSDSQRERLERLPFVDAVVQFQGEEDLLAHVRSALATNPPMHSDQTPCSSLDSVSSDCFLGCSYDRYYQPHTIPVLVSRGCYWGRCAFCDQNMLYRPSQRGVFETRSVPNVVAEMEMVQSVFPADDVTVMLISQAVPPKYFTQLAEALIDRGVHLPINAYIRAEAGCDGAFFALLRKAGVRELIIGAEAVVDRVLERMNKGTIRDTITRVVHAAAAEGIRVILNFIPDFPGITLEEFADTLSYIREHRDVLHFNFNQFALSVNSEMARDPSKYGISLYPQEKPLLTSEGGMHSLDYIRTESPLTSNQIRDMMLECNQLYNELQEYNMRRRLGRTDWDSDVELCNAVLEAQPCLYLKQIPFARTAEGSYQRTDHGSCLVINSRSNRHAVFGSQYRDALTLIASGNPFRITDVAAHMGTAENGVQESIKVVRRLYQLATLKESVQDQRKPLGSVLA